MTKPTAKDLKSTLAHYLYWNLQYPVICDEFNFIDLLGIRRSGYAVEFEIKVSKSDLNRELKCIAMKEDEVIKHGKDWTKWKKHQDYLGKPMAEIRKSKHDFLYEKSDFTLSRAFIPSEFYFYVPDYLAEYATKRVIEMRLPYGVVVYDFKHKPNMMGYSMLDNYYIMKKPVKLHKEKVNDSLYRQLAHALTIRNRILK